MSPKSPIAILVRCLAIASVVSTVFVAAVVRIAAQDSLDAAKAFYAAASYEEALSALALMPTDSLNNADTVQSVRQYRALCLMALGRAGDAEKVLEDMVKADPIYRPGKGELPPRLDTMYRNVRARVLPAATREEYGRAKAAFDARDFSAAEARFARVLTLVEDLDGNTPTEPSLADVRTLADGFLQLSRASGGTRAAPARDSPRPGVRAARDSAVQGLAANGDTAAEGNTQAVALKQNLPPWPSAVPLQRGYSGVIEVTVTATGDVSDVKFVKPVHPVYDRLIRASAKEWKYVPATIAGQPVISSKMITVKIARKD